ncbi:MAG TPA: hypothetical protein PKC28_12435 [Bdellovibrionales bacterium]|nr:hypothetical protein [Bdellovibrionales bacterium]
MPFTKLSLLLFFCSSFALASGGGGEAAKPAEGTPKEQKEFTEKIGKLTTLTNRIADAEHRFQELVRKKEATRDIELKQGYIKEMVELTKQRNKDVEAYNKLKSELTYRYPNQGEQLNRRYHTQSKRSLEELEGVAGLDELLTRVKKTIERKFAPFEDPEEAKPKAKAKAPASVDGEIQKLRLEK